MTTGFIPAQSYIPTMPAPTYNAVKIDVHSPVMNSPAQPMQAPVIYSYPNVPIYAETPQVNKTTV